MIPYGRRMREGRNQVTQRTNGAALCLVLLILLWRPWASADHAPHFEIGVSKVALGSPSAPLMTELQRDFSVRAIEGGWELHSRAPDGDPPRAAIGVSGGLIHDVSLRWGPGRTPTVETVARQLAAALPDRGECRVENVTAAKEGGTVRTLRWQCGTYAVAMVSGTWPGGNTLALDLTRVQRR